MIDAIPRSALSPLASSVDDEQDGGLQLYADGCFEPEDGTGGWSFVVFRDGLEIASDFGGMERATNNAMELVAVLNAALWVSSNSMDEPAVIWSDSIYSVKGCNSLRPIWKSWGWRKKGPNAHARSRAIVDQALWQSVDAVLSKNALVTIEWCKGHCGILGNERADRLAELGRQSLTLDACK